jgi:hypothetical protein
VKIISTLEVYLRSSGQVVEVAIDDGLGRVHFPRCAVDSPVQSVPLVGDDAVRYQVLISVARLG